MRQHPLRYAVSVMLILWILYSASGFRHPLTPILHADNYEGAAIRQALFSLAALSSIALMFLTGNLGKVLCMNRSMLWLSILVPASIIWSAAPTLTLKRSILFLFGLITLYSIVHAAKKPASSMLQLLTTSAAAIALVSLTIHFAFGQAYTVNPMRPGLAGITSHPNTLAPIMSIGFIASLGIHYKHALLKYCLRIQQLLILISLILAQSITTLSTTLLAIGIYTLLAMDSYKRGLQQILIVLTLIAISIIGFNNLKQTAFEVTGRDESLSGRDEVWSIVANEALQRPIFGRGFGAFWTEGKGRELVHSWNPRQSHNAYLDLWVDLGLIGLIALLIAYPGKLFIRWKSIQGSDYSHQRKAVAALYAIAITYMLTYALAQSYFLRFDTFTFMSLTWVILIIGNTDQNRIENEFSTPHGIHSNKEVNQ